MATVHAVVMVAEAIQVVKGVIVRRSDEVQEAVETAALKVGVVQEEIVSYRSETGAAQEGAAQVDEAKRKRYQQALLLKKP